jgi:hypothetical protein
MIIKKRICIAGANLRVSCIKRLALYCLIMISAYSCVNPFAPGVDENIGKNNSIISDQKTIDGIFQNLQYAYSFKDTLIYGQVLDKNFSFSFRDYDRGVDVSWGRDDEMRVTYGLFQNTQRLDLVWNNIVSITADSTGIVRSFNLTITFDPTDIVYVEGRVNLTLIKDSNKMWKLLRWIDESNF